MFNTVTDIHVMNRLKLTSLLLPVFLVAPAMASASEVNVYSARQEALIKPLLDKFTGQTGIKTNLITGKAAALQARMKNEGRNTPADLFITVDAGNLHRAKEAGLLQQIGDAGIAATVPTNLQDNDGYWVGLSKRARVIFYAPDRVDPGELSTYEALTDGKWKGRVCIRSSSNIYNQSLVASMIADQGVDAAEQWAAGIVANMARPPSGGDRDQIKAVAAGQCDIAVSNTYYYGAMLNHKTDSSQVEAAKKVAVFWPNQADRGAHINVSGAGISKYSRNRDNAVALLEFLLSEESQQWYAAVNHEYPVIDAVTRSETVASWGTFKSDDLNLSRLGDLNAEAVKAMDRAGWK